MNKKKKITIFSIIYIASIVLYFLCFGIIVGSKGYSGKNVVAPLGWAFLGSCCLTLVLIGGLVGYTEKKRTVFTLFFCIANTVLLLFMPLINTGAFLLGELVVNSIVLIWLIYLSMYYKAHFPKGEKGKWQIPMLIAIAIPWLIMLFVSQSGSMFEETLFFIYIAVLTGVITIVFVLLYLTVLGKEFSVLAKTVSKKLVIILFTLCCSFLYSGLVVLTVNEGIPSERQMFTSQIVDKHVGGRYGTSSYFSVIHNGKRISIGVPPYVYNDKEIGNSVSFYIYEGFLSIPYVVYAK